MNQNIPIKAKIRFDTWFKGSKVVKRGKPEILYHGTMVSTSFTKFKVSDEDIGIHFGTLDVAESVIDMGGKNARIIPAYLRIIKPLIIKDVDSWYWDTIMYEFYHRRMGAKPFIKKGVPFTLQDMIKVNSRIKLLRMLAKYGYDGIKYKNLYEDEVTNSFSYIVFKASQIWPIYMGRPNPIKY